MAGKPVEPPVLLGPTYALWALKHDIDKIITDSERRRYLAERQATRDKPKHKEARTR